MTCSIKALHAIGVNRVQRLRNLRGARLKGEKKNPSRTTDLKPVIVAIGLDKLYFNYVAAERLYSSWVQWSQFNCT